MPKVYECIALQTMLGYLRKQSWLSIIMSRLLGKQLYSHWDPRCIACAGAKHTPAASDLACASSQGEEESHLYPHHFHTYSLAASAD